MPEQIACRHIIPIELTKGDIGPSKIPEVNPRILFVIGGHNLA
jgi:hypothetical protein